MNRGNFPWLPVVIFFLLAIPLLGWGWNLAHWWEGSTPPPRIRDEMQPWRIEARYVFWVLIGVVALVMGLGTVAMRVLAGGGDEEPIDYDRL